MSGNDPLSAPTRDGDDAPPTPRAAAAASTRAGLTMPPAARHTNASLPDPSVGNNANHPTDVKLRVPLLRNRAEMASAPYSNVSSHAKPSGSNDAYVSSHAAADAFVNGGPRGIPNANPTNTLATNDRAYGMHAFLGQAGITPAEATHRYLADPGVGQSRSANSYAAVTDPHPTNPTNGGSMADIIQAHVAVAKERERFADPDSIKGDALLDLALQYSTQDIAERINIVAGKKVVEARHIGSRLRVAIKNHASRTGKTEELVHSQLQQGRKCNGVKTTRRRPKRKAAAVEDDADACEGEATGSQMEQVPSAETRWTRPQNTATVGGPASEVQQSIQAKIAAFYNAGLTSDQTYIASNGDADNDLDISMADAINPVPVFGVPAETFTSASVPSDADLFADVDNLKGEKLLQVAVNYSTTELHKQILQHCPQANLGAAGVSARISRALDARARSTGRSAVQERSAFDNARVANGTRAQRRNPAPGAKSTLGMQNPVTAPSPMGDVEMEGSSTISAGSQGSQQGYNAAELEAANALLALAAHERVNSIAAHRAVVRPGSPTESEVSETELNEEELAHFWATLQEE